MNNIQNVYNDEHVVELLETIERLQTVPEFYKLIHFVSHLAAVNATSARTSTGDDAIAHQGKSDVLKSLVGLLEPTEDEGVTISGNDANE